MVSNRAPLSLLTILLAIAVFPSASHAWNHTGHRVTAAIAWAQMTPESRAEATRLLKAHPGYRRDLLAELPEGYDADKWAFMSAAVWPDMVRSDQHPMHNQNRPAWHFVNYPYAPDGNNREVPEPDETWQPGKEPNNVIQEIKKARHESGEPGFAGCREGDIALLVSAPRR